MIWRRRRRRVGRPPLAKAHQEFIRWISFNSVLWGAPRVHGEIRKLGLNVSQTTVAKYMGPRTTRPSQSWRVFLRNHARELIRSGEFRDQRDDLEGRCSGPGSTVDEILSADLLDSSCAKSSSRQPGESIERVAGFTERVFYRPNERVPVLASYFELMGRMLPEFLTVLSRVVEEPGSL